MRWVASQFPYEFIRPGVHGATIIPEVSHLARTWPAGGELFDPHNKRPPRPPGN